MRLTTVTSTALQRARRLGSSNDLLIVFVVLAVVFGGLFIMCCMISLVTS